MMYLCPIRYTETTHTHNAMCDKTCAWYINGDCAVVSLHDVANEVSNGLDTLSNVIFDTLGSYKTGDALDAIVSMSEAAAWWNTRAERTCELIDFTEHVIMDEPDIVELSCGHDCMVLGEENIPNYCPQCGARVVS